MNKGTTTNVRSLKQLGSNMMMVFITLLSAFAMMATDLYLPAVPTMKDQLNTTVVLNWRIDIGMQDNNGFFIF